MFKSEINKAGTLAKLLNSVSGHDGKGVITIAQSAVDADVEAVIKNDSNYSEGKEFPEFWLLNKKIKIVPDVQIVNEK